MNRLEELTSRLLEGLLGEDESRELDSLLADDVEARRQFAGLCETEAALRGLQAAPGLADRVMLRIREEPSLVALYQAAESPGRQESAPVVVRRFLPAWLQLAAAFVLLFGVGAFVLSRAYRGGRVVPASYVLATVAQVEGEVALLTRGERSQLEPGMALHAGDVVHVSPSALTAIRYSDGTRLVLSAGTQAELASRPGERGAGSKVVMLYKGVLTAHVKRQQPGQTLAVHTPAADVVVHGTRFLLRAEEASTRLDVLEGAVGLRRTEDAAEVEVRKGEFVVARPEGELVTTVLPPRIRDGLVVLYGFDEGEGRTIRDVSGVGDALDLHIESPGGTTWLPAARGLLFEKPGTFAATREPAVKIAEACGKSHELTVEAWITPATVDQIGPARIVTVSQDTSRRNFTLGQDGRLDQWPPPGGTFFVARLRTTDTGENGVPPLHTSIGSAPTDLAHVVYTRSRSGLTRLFIDGVTRAKGEVAGDFSSWDPGCRLALGDEFTHDRPWVGSYHLVAVYGRALAADEVLTNYRAGLPDRE